MTQTKDLTAFIFPFRAFTRQFVIYQNETRKVIKIQRMKGKQKRKMWKPRITIVSQCGAMPPVGVSTPPPPTSPPPHTPLCCTGTPCPAP